MNKFATAGTVIILTLAPVCWAQAWAQAAGSSMTLTLAPHCADANRSACPSFAVQDAQSLKTDHLAAGDILDIDVVLNGPDFASVESIRSWLQYDPAVLEARSVDLTSAINAPTPDEQGIDATQGFVKIGGGTAKAITASSTALARVTFRVTSTAKNTTISFYDYMIDGTGHTAANGPYGQAGDNKGVLPPAPCFGNIIGCRGAPTPLLQGRPSDLVVVLQTDSPAPAASTASSGAPAAVQPAATSTTGQGNPAPSSAPTVTSSASSNPYGAAPGKTGTSGTPQGSSFPQLQVQNLRVTTKDTAAYVVWDALRSAELAGYNVYYGTVSGRYIQRRSVGSGDTSLTLRDLESGVTYYFAVRGVNAANDECSFSQEVAVTIGNPQSSTAPLDVTSAEHPLPEGNPITTRHGGEINGATGIADTVTYTLILSTAVGTILAFRRQMVLSLTPAYVR